MAQLSDDCFAFGGKLLTIDAALALIAADVRCIEGIEHVSARCRGRPRARRGRGRAARPAALRQLGRGRLRGAPGRSGQAPRACRWPDASRPGRPPPRRSSRGPPGASSPAPHCPPGADTVFMQEDVRLDERGRVHFPAGLRQGANTRPRGRGRRAAAHARCRQGDGCARRIWRSPRRSGCGDLPVRAPGPRRAVLDRGRAASSRAARGAGAALRHQPRAAGRPGGARRGAGHRSRHPARPARGHRRRPRGRCAGPRPDPHLRRRLGRRGGPRPGSGRGSRPARVLAAGDQARPAGRDGQRRGRAVRRDCPATRSRPS